MPTKLPKPSSYQMLDHACHKCGGRILARANPGPGISGMSAYLCSCCEESGVGMGNPPMCYCNLHFRGSETRAYRCIHQRELITKPWLKNACYASGFDPESNQVIGIICRATEREAERKQLEI